MVSNGIVAMLNNYHEHCDIPNDSEISSDEEIKSGDDTTEYLHIMLTSGQDQCSRASLPDVLQLLTKMKKLFKFYKTANISYLSRGNKDLKKEMLDMIMRL